MGVAQPPYPKRSRRNQFVLSKIELEISEGMELQNKNNPAIINCLGHLNLAGIALKPSELGDGRCTTSLPHFIKSAQIRN